MCQFSLKLMNLAHQTRNEIKPLPRMKILLFSQYFWPETFLINSLTAKLVSAGHTVDVLTGQPNYPHGNIYPGYRARRCSTETYKGALLHRIPILPRASGGLRLALNYLSFILSGMLFGPWTLRKRHVDVILVYAPSPLLQALPAIFFGWLRCKPVVLWVQDLWPESLSATGYVRNPVILKGVEYVIRFIYRHIDLILVQSAAFVEPVRKLAPGAKIVYLPNSVDDSFAQRADVDSDAEKIFTVLFAGNLGAAQAVDCILGAAEILRAYPDVRFELVGDGSQWTWLRDEIARKGLGNVNLPGRCPVEEMPKLMQQSSALLVTLRAEKIFEYTVPSKVQAYMACGRPIIAAINGEGARIIREAGAGLTVPAEDAHALAQTILELRSFPEARRSAMGAAGHAFYLKHYREESVVKSLLEYLEQVTSGKKEK